MEWKREPSFQTCTSTVYHFFFLEYSGAGNMSISISNIKPSFQVIFSGLAEMLEFKRQIRTD